MKNLFLLITFALFSTVLMANKGTIKGTVIDKSTGESIIGAYVTVESSSIGTTTDFDGNYVLELEAGNYSISYSYLGYSKTTKSEIKIISGQEISLDIALYEEATALEEVVIKGKVSQKTEAAVMMLQKKSASLLDGISSQSFSKMGASDAAAAVKRVPGVSIEGGKYVFVRGLGDRYSKTLLNGMTIPGLDPDRNTVQMNLFPSNLIDKIIVYKTFTPDLSGDFTGGLVDVVTKDFPERKALNVSISTGLTTGMNFNDNNIGYQKGNTDWLGFAGEDRKLQFSENSVIPDESTNDPNLYRLSSLFQSELGVTHNAATSLNQSYAVYYGNNMDVKNMKIGLNLAANYGNSYKNYNDVYQGLFFKDSDNTYNMNLDKREVSRGSIGQQEVTWSALAGGAIKIDNHKIGLSLLHTQSGTGKVAEFVSQNFDETNVTLYKNAIEYAQKSVTNMLLSGNHKMKSDRFSIDWRISPTYSNILEPDIRSTRLSYDVDTDSYNMKLGDGAGIDRYFRTLNEINLSSKVDLEHKIKQWKGIDSKIKYGFSNTYKNRDYQILLYQFNKTTDFNDFSADFNDILQPENLWTPENNSGLYVVGNRNRNNEYVAVANVMAGYVMNELPINNKLKANYGLRVENAKINYQGHYNNEAIDSLVHNETVFLPSINLVYELVENMNLRASFTQTVARPSFKEKSNAHIDDPISQTVFIGNLELKESNINNYDLRWEYFKGKQMISLSGFYKEFNNPIELVPFELSPNNVQPKNIENAKLFGAELELKKRISGNSENFLIDLGSNFTYIVSQVNMRQVEVDISGKTEYDLRVENARMLEGGKMEEIDPIRPMQGQAPYIVNANINLLHVPTRIETNISYNVMGEKLVVVGSGIIPDVYEDPFHSLNLKLTKKFGENDRLKLGVSASNILGDNFYQYYSSYEADKETYRSYSNGRGFNLSLSYKFF